jgi:hypothetical protein
MRWFLGGIRGRFFVGEHLNRAFSEELPGNERSQDSSNTCCTLFGSAFATLTAGHASKNASQPRLTA